MSLVDAIIFSGGKASGGGGVTPPPSPDDYIPVVVGDSPITLVSGSRYSFNTSGGPITANLPATPTQGSVVYVYFDSVSDLNPVTFNAGSETIEGSSSLIAGATYNGLFYTIAWNATETDWKTTQTCNTDGSSGGSSVGESSIVAIRALTKLISGADVQDFATGNWYEYDAIETAPDDGINYLTPNSIIEPDPGRWVLRREDSWEGLGDVFSKTGNSKKIPKISDNELTIEPTDYDWDSLVFILESAPTEDRVVTRNNAGTYEQDTVLQEQYPPLGTLPSQDFSTGQATYTGIKGQIAYDSSYKYECIALDTWIRSALTKGIIDLYLTPDIDDSLGAKTSLELDTAYPTAKIGQRVWGTNSFVYEKKAVNIWKKTASTTA